MPQGSKDGISRACIVCSHEPAEAKLRAQLFGSGTILTEALKAQHDLEEKYEVGADVWSGRATSACIETVMPCERWNRLHPASRPNAYVTKGHQGRARRVRGGVGLSEGAAGFDSIAGCRSGCRRSAPTVSDAATRAPHRNFFEVDSRFIVLAALYALMKDKQIEASVVEQAIKDLRIETEKPNPAIS